MQFRTLALSYISCTVRKHPQNQAPCQIREPRKNRWHGFCNHLLEAPRSPAAQEIDKPPPFGRVGLVLLPTGPAIFSGGE